MINKIILALICAALIYFGGFGIQSENTIFRGMGFAGIFASIVFLYILIKVLWSMISFSMFLLIIGCIALYFMYSVGMLNADGVIGHFFNQEPRQVSAMQASEMNDVVDSQYNISPNLGETKNAVDVYAEAEDDEYAEDDERVNENAPAKEMSAEDKSRELVDKVTKLFGVAKETDQAFDFNPIDYPAIKGRVSVITGSVLRIKSINVKLLGIDAPDAMQTCSNHRGQAYNCGRKAISWLQNWIDDREVECRILGKVVKHWATGVCFIGNYDLAAVIANAGWAVAYTKNTDVYLPYEQQARENSRGLWSGKFYRPSDWRKLQTRSAEVVIERKSAPEDSWFNMDGWF